ncbi:MAG: hypothetical protein ACP5I4_12980 [Oceanipulchritudo sp.]
MSDVDTSGYTGAVPQPAYTVTPQPDGSRLIEWTDAAGNELGFRVARRIDGGLWRTIAYRPRRSLLPSASGTDPWSSVPVNELNPPAWRDYNVPAAATSVDYAVIAFDAEDLVPVNVEPLQMDDALQVWFETKKGLNYQLYTSADLDGWDPLGNPVAGSGAPTLLHKADPSPKAFFRVVSFRDNPES